MAPLCVGSLGGACHYRTRRRICADVPGGDSTDSSTIAAGLSLAGRDAAGRFLPLLGVMTPFSWPFQQTFSFRDFSSKLVCAPAGGEYLPNLLSKCDVLSHKRNIS